MLPAIRHGCGRIRRAPGQRSTVSERRYACPPEDDGSVEQGHLGHTHEGCTACSQL